ncbi:hypothetical protein DFQ27_004668 [Actinomortierella ambigua]|uniref:SH3 domain-containing protein n=1 Tax=Actinomortierella ambigua TaxID=1343610 RepID=A0A9P6Q172_9FUNG|nr:hypothetical protein DFQ27_004668 [Actinomortierella ambigua]
MASTGLGGGSLSNLASSLRSASMATASQDSHHAYNNSNNSTSTNPNYPNNNTTNHNNISEVPDSHYHDTYAYEDDSTEEDDEEYATYIKEQQQQQHKEQQHNLVLSRHDSSDMSHDEDHAQHRHQLHDDMGNSGGAHHAQDQLVPAMLELDHQNEDDEDLEDDDEEEEEDEDEDDDESETISLTEDDIDFDLVYALHTFVATQEGQASVVRNDPLMLLEDTNVYWWLVRVLKTGVIGYIPAENIETPFERLARLNKYRNVGLSAPQAIWDDFNPRPNIELGSSDKPSNRKSVIFTAQNEFFGGSDAEWDDDEYDEEGEWYGDEGDEEDEDEDMDEDDEGTGESAGEDGASQAHLDQEARQLAMSMGADQEAASTEKTEIQLEAERMEREIMEEQRQREALEAQAQAQVQAQAQSQARAQAVQRQIDSMDIDQLGSADRSGANDRDDDTDDSDDDVNITNRYRKPLLDEDDFILDAEPKIISLTPAIARDDIPINRGHTAPGKAKKLRLSSDSTQHLNDRLSLDSEEEEREVQRQRMEERRNAKMQALFGNGNTVEPPRKTKEEYEAGLPPEVVVKKPGKFKSLFGVVKGSKDKEKEKERKERERQEKEKSKNRGGGGITGASAGIFRSRSNSNGSIGSNSSGGLKSPPLTGQAPEGASSTQEIITLRVYPGNVDFGASMYKTVIVNSQTLASEVANQAVVKFRLAPDGVASSADFFLTVKGVDGDETVLQQNDKPMAIYQSLTSHLTTPLPKDHRLSISSVSSMMSINSTNSYMSNTPSSPNSVRRIGSGKVHDPAQRSIRFFLNKKIRRSGSTSGPSTPTTPTMEDFVWVKVICLAQDLPASVVVLEGMSTVTPRELLQSKHVDPASFASKIELWLPLQVISNVGDVVYKALERMEIRTGVVDGVAEHFLKARRMSAPDGLLIHYQLSLQLMALPPGLAMAHKMGDEISLLPETPLHKCLEDHRLMPIRRSPKADVASMPTAPDYIFYLRKAAKSVQAEEEVRQKKQTGKKVPEPLQAQSLHSASQNGGALEPGLSSPTSPRGHRSMSNDIGSRPLSPGSPMSPQQQHARSIMQAALQSTRGPASPTGGALPSGVRIPRRTDSVVMGPTSPIKSTIVVDGSGRPSPTPSIQSLQQQQQQQQQQHVQSGAGSRTPTPDQLAMRQRARSPSVGQGQAPSSPLLRSQQVPSPAPSNLSNYGVGGADQDESRSLTPDRVHRAERAQRVTSPTMSSHGPSPLSLSSSVPSQEQERSASRESTNQAKAMSSWQRDSTMSTRDEMNYSRPTSAHGLAASKVAPLNIKKNSTQGVDIVLNKGVIRSSRLINSRQYRYSFIPTEGGEEIDISEIIEDILGEDDEDDLDEDEDDGHLEILPVIHDDEPPGTPTQESMSHKDRAAAAVARASQTVAASMARRQASASSPGHHRPQRSVSNSSGMSRTSTQERDVLEHLGQLARGGDTLLKLERVLKSVDGVSDDMGGRSPMASTPTMQHQQQMGEFAESEESLQILDVSNSAGNSPMQPSIRTMHSNSSSPTPGGSGSRTGSPISARSMDSQYASKGWPSSTGPFANSPIARSGSPSQHLKKRDSDVEIQVASVATLSARSVSPMPMVRSVTPGSPQSLRPGSPYGVSRSTLSASPAGAGKPLSSLGMAAAAAAAVATTTGGADVSGAGGVEGAPSSSRSFSPIPRRLQQGSGASSPSSLNGGSQPLSVQTSTLLPSLGPSSAGSNVTGSPASLRSGTAGAAGTQLRSRSASASVAETNSGARMPGSGNRDMTKEQWLLSSDYNAGMQDLLTLVRGGRSSSVSHVSTTSTGFGALSRAGGMGAIGGIGGVGGGAYIGPDGKLVQLPSAFKASLLSHSKAAKKLKELKSSTTSRHDTQGQAGYDADGNQQKQQQQQQRSERSNDQHHHNLDNDDKQSGISHDDNQYDKKKKKNHDALLEEEDEDDGDDDNSSDDGSLKMQMLEFMTRELSLKDVAPDCHPEVLACWQEVDAALDRVEGELDALLAKVKTTVF